jgi:D-glycero-beta-D-manno-heptose 1-phosphate adenylyltransferase
MKLKYDLKSKIFENFDSFEKILKKWKSDREKIVFTNGCFDLIHLGHVDSLLKSANLGTRLIVGLNSDESVRALKGKGRPILNLEARTTLLAAFEFVDAIIIFSEDTPEKLISQIIPDILVKGNEYAIHEIAGNRTVLQHGGEVKTLDLVPGVSTTEMINKIKNLD